MVKIRPLEQLDWDAWKPLWDGYLNFYRQSLEPEVTAETFRRLCARADGMRGLLALSGDERGTAVGFAHLLLHPSTWTTGSYCYLEDLFVSPAARGGEVGRRLIEAVYREADAAGAASVYWHTQEYNGPARSLYDQLGHRTSFVVYER
jgi:GNAT superfamily N-acetyltransferase